jgi:pyruvate dehydrogenase phosphatase
MLRRSWKPIIGTTVLVGGPSYLYYKHSKPTQQTFDFPVRVRGPDGKATMTTRSFNLLTKSDVDARLSANAHTHTPTLTSGHAYTYTTASLASNNPIEDASASAVLPRREALGSQTTAAGDLLFHAVMDGHGGYHTSRLLSKILIPAVALELKELIEEPSQVAPKGNVLMNFMRSFFGSASNGSSSPTAFDADPRYVSVAMQSAFANLDSELINAPLKLLAQNVDAKARESKVLPDLSQHPMALATMLPAMSGALLLLYTYRTAHTFLAHMQVAALF